MGRRKIFFWRIDGFLALILLVLILIASIGLGFTITKDGLFATMASVVLGAVSTWLGVVLAWLYFRSFTRRRALSRILRSPHLDASPGFQGYHSRATSAELSEPIRHALQAMTASGSSAGKYLVGARSETQKQAFDNQFIDHAAVSGYVTIRIEGQPKPEEVDTIAFQNFTQLARKCGVNEDLIQRVWVSLSRDRRLIALLSQPDRGRFFVSTEKYLNDLDEALAARFLYRLYLVDWDASTAGFQPNTFLPMPRAVLPESQALANDEQNFFSGDRLSELFQVEPEYLSHVRKRLVALGYSPTERGSLTPVHEVRSLLLQYMMCLFKFDPKDVEQLEDTLGLIGSTLISRGSRDLFWSDLDLANSRKLSLLISVMVREGILLERGDALRFENSIWESLAISISDCREASFSRPEIIAARPSRTDLLRFSLDAHSAVYLADRLSHFGLKQAISTFASAEAVAAEPEILLALWEGIRGGPSQKASLKDFFEWLEIVWPNTNDTFRVKALYAAALTQSRDGTIWIASKIAPPGSKGNSYLVRRAAVRALVENPELSFESLRESWNQVLNVRHRNFLRSSRANDDWGIQVTVAHLAWLFPQMLAASPLLAKSPKFRNLLSRVTEICRHPESEIGLETSLAEGYSYAIAFLGNNPDGQVEILETIIELAENGRSWLSRLNAANALDIIFKTKEGQTELLSFVKSLLRTGIEKNQIVRARHAATLRVKAGVRSWWLNEFDELAGGGFGIGVQTHQVLGAATLLVNAAESARRLDSEARPTVREALLAAQGFVLRVRGQKLIIHSMSNGGKALVYELGLDELFAGRVISSFFRERARVLSRGKILLTPDGFADFWFWLQISRVWKY